MTATPFSNPVYAPGSHSVSVEEVEDWTIIEMFDLEHAFSCPEMKRERGGHRERVKSQSHLMSFLLVSLPVSHGH